MFILLFLNVGFSVQAAPPKKVILVTYMTKTGAPSPESYLWEATFSAFAEDITFLPVDEVTKKDVESSEVIVFIGEMSGYVPTEFRDNLKNFDGKVIAFGNNAEQLPPFDNWRFLRDEKLRELDGEALETALIVRKVIPPKESDVLAVGKTLDEEISFIATYKNATYIAATTTNSQEKLVVSQSIYDLLDIDAPTYRPASIRLEDVNPLSDPELLQEAGNYLVEHGIPFYISINPIYEDEQKGAYQTLADNGVLVEVLRDLQNQGAMLIVHGYTNSHLSNEEGYELRDIELNQKVTRVNTRNERTRLLAREAFVSKETYARYMNDVNAVEKGYIEEKLSKSIDELTELGLYPISFLPPHYAMGLSGYDVLSGYFSSIFGNLQWSDRDVNVTNVPLFVTSPAMTNRIKVYPETIGFVNLMHDRPLEEMEKSVRQLEKVPGAVISGVYHAYLGAAYLPELVELIESVGPVEWLDLRKDSEFPQTEPIEIKSKSNDQSLYMVKERADWHDLVSVLQIRPLEVILWGISGVVILFLFAFFIYITRLRVQLRKRLFEERETYG